MQSTMAAGIYIRDGCVPSVYVCLVVALVAVKKKKCKNKFAK